MDKYDLVICGGGTAGCAAGYIAAKYGLKTLIVEKNIHLGGTITSGLVIPAMKSDTKGINQEFYNDFTAKLNKYGASVTYCDGNNGWFNPELVKIALDEMMSDVSCDILFDSEVKNVLEIKDKIIKTIEISSKSLSLYIESMYFVDSTGDGNFSAILKNKILKNNSTRQPMTMRFHISGIDLKTFSDWLLEIDKDRDVTTCCEVNGQIHLSTACTWDRNRQWALWPYFEKGIQEKVLQEEDASYFQIFTVPSMPGTVSLNCPRVFIEEGFDPLSAKILSKAYTKARAQIWRIYNFLKLTFPGFENSYISNIADMAGIRESRRIEGKHVYTKEDIVKQNTYDSPVLHGDYPIDIHSSDKDKSVLEHTEYGYELPVESLIAADYNNLFIAGRCLSATFEAQAALRVQRSCFAMGEAVAKYVVKLVKN